MDSQSHYFKVLAGVERPSRYMGDEFGQIAPPPEPRLRVGLGFPDVYEVGMSHLGFRLLHAGLCDRGDLQVERFFLPWPDLQRRLQQTNTPLCTLERFVPLSQLHLLGLSVQYELALPSVLRLLDLAQIPRRAADRARSGGAPLGSGAEGAR